MLVVETTGSDRGLTKDGSIYPVHNAHAKRRRPPWGGNAHFGATRTMKHHQVYSIVDPMQQRRPDLRNAIFSGESPVKFHMDDMDLGGECTFEYGIRSLGPRVQQVVDSSAWLRVLSEGT